MRFVSRRARQPLIDDGQHMIPREYQDTREGVARNIVSVDDNRTSLAHICISDASNKRHETCSWHTLKLAYSRQSNLRTCHPTTLALITRLTCHSTTSRLHRFDPID